MSIENIINHPDYEASKNYYDIAIVELAESLNFGPLISPACLWNDPETSSLDKLLITGWGVVHPGKIRQKQGMFQNILCELVACCTGITI